MTSDNRDSCALCAVGDEAFGFRVREICDLHDVSGRIWHMEFAQN